MRIFRSANITLIESKAMRYRPALLVRIHSNINERLGDLSIKASAGTTLSDAEAAQTD
jgi:hypothetical protein